MGGPRKFKLLAPEFRVGRSRQALGLDHVSGNQRSVVTLLGQSTQEVSFTMKFHRSTVVQVRYKLLVTDIAFFGPRLQRSAVDCSGHASILRSSGPQTLGEKRNCYMFFTSWVLVLFSLCSPLPVCSICRVFFQFALLLNRAESRLVGWACESRLWCARCSSAASCGSRSSSLAFVLFWDV